MLIEILKRTPPWVFVLFVVLISLGYVQSKDRTVSRGKVAILPVAMVLLSFYGVLSAFGLIPIGLALWAIGTAVSVWFGVKLGAPHGVTYSAETQLFFIPGSWAPLALMMSIFFTKYAVGVIMARQLLIATETMFMGVISLCYGLFSGVFFARAVVIRKATKYHA